MSKRASASNTPIIKWSRDNFIGRTYRGQALPKPAVYEQRKKAPGSFELTPAGLVEVREV